MPRNPEGAQSKGKKPKTPPQPASRPGRRASDSPMPAPKDDATISPEERYRMIAEAAYYRAQRRGFLGDPLQDWLEAEVEVATKLGEIPRRDTSAAGSQRE